MNTTTNRRGILGLFAAAPVAAAGSSPAAILGRARATSLSIPGVNYDYGALGQAVDRVRVPSIPGIGAAIERAHPLQAEIQSDHAGLLAQLDVEPGAERRATPEARAIAALAVVFPPEIAAYRSFAPHLRRRLYAELLTREARRAATDGTPPTPPQTGSGA